MSIWTSRPILIAVLLALSACGGGPGTLTAPDTRPAPSEVTVTTDQVVVTGPAGYCIDPTETHDRGDTAFVLMGNCAAISNSSRAPQPSVPSILTASISAPSAEGSLRTAIPGLDRFFRTEGGRRLLSRSQDPNTVTIIDSFHQGNIYYLHARDTSEGPFDGAGKDYWRAYLDVGPRIATLSVLALADNETSLDTLRGFTSAFAAANRPEGRTPPAAAVPVQDPRPSAPVTTPSRNTAPLWNVGLFRRIFG
ncbi:MAG: hypothetical protein GDA52_06280 [Rhodobacteraceae bacterium]|nr:hypothetical protein [Paracoccaceae bacterium]